MNGSSDLDPDRVAVRLQAPAAEVSMPSSRSSVNVVGLAADRRRMMLTDTRISMSIDVLVSMAPPLAAPQVALLTAAALSMA